MSTETLTVKVKFQADGSALVGGVKVSRDELDKMRGSADSARAGLDGLAGSVKTFIGAWAGYETIRAAGKAWNDFDTATRNTANLTGAALDDVKAKAMESGIAFGRFAGDAASAFGVVGSKTPALLEMPAALQAVTNQSLELADAAKATGDAMTDADAAMAITAGLNQWGVAAQDAAKEADHFGNVLAAGAQFGSASVSSMVDSMKQSGTVAASAGLSIEQYAATLQVMASKQIEGAEAGTALRNTINFLLTKGDDFEDFGIKAESVNPKLVGMQTALENLAPILDNDAALAKIFGAENLTAAKVLIQNAGAIGEMTDKLTGTNTAYEQAQAGLQTFSRQAEILQANLQNIAAGQIDTVFGDSALIAITEVNDGLRWVLENQNEIRIAGVAMTGGLLTSYEELRYSAEVAFTAVANFGGESAADVQRFFADMTAYVTQKLANLAQGAGGFSSYIPGMSDATTKLAALSQELNSNAHMMRENASAIGFNKVALADVTAAHEQRKAAISDEMGAMASSIGEAKGMQQQTASMTKSVAESAVTMPKAALAAGNLSKAHKDAAKASEQHAKAVADFTGKLQEQLDTFYMTEAEARRYKAAHDGLLTPANEALLKQIEELEAAQDEFKYFNEASQQAFEDQQKFADAAKKAAISVGKAFSDSAKQTQESYKKAMGEVGGMFEDFLGNMARGGDLGKGISGLFGQMAGAESSKGTISDALKGAGGFAGIFKELGGGDLLGGLLGDSGEVTGILGEFGGQLDGIVGKLGGMGNVLGIANGVIAGFNGDMKGLGSSLGSAAGMAFGGPIGSLIGGQLGGLIGGQFNGETRAGGQYAYGPSGVRKTEGPSGGEIAGDQMRAAIQKTVDTTNELLKKLGSTAQIVESIAKLETSSAGKGGVFFGGTLSGGQTFGERSWEKGTSRNLNAEEAVAAFSQDLEQGIIQALQAASDTPDWVRSLLDGVDAESLSSAQVGALLANIEAVDGAMSALEGFGISAGQITPAMLEAAGGAQNFAASAQIYYNALGAGSLAADNAAAQLKQYQDTLAASFDELGVAMPATRGEFQALVESLDLSSESGQKLYGGLIELAPEFLVLAEAQRKAWEDSAQGVDFFVLQLESFKSAITEQQVGNMLVDSVLNATSAADAGSRFSDAFAQAFQQQMVSMVLSTVSDMVYSGIVQPMLEASAMQSANTVSGSAAAAGTLSMGGQVAASGMASGASVAAQALAAGGQTAADYIAGIVGNVKTTLEVLGQVMSDPAITNMLTTITPALQDIGAMTYTAVQPMIQYKQVAGQIADTTRQSVTATQDLSAAREQERAAAESQRQAAEAQREEERRLADEQRAQSAAADAAAKALEREQEAQYKAAQAAEEAAQAAARAAAEFQAAFSDWQTSIRQDFLGENTLSQNIAQYARDLGVSVTDAAQFLSNLSTEQAQQYAKDLGVSVEEAMNAASDALKQLQSDAAQTSQQASAPAASGWNTGGAADRGSYQWSVRQEEELTTARADTATATSDAADAEAKALEERLKAAAFNSDLSKEIARFNMSGQELDLAQLGDWFDETRAKAEETGADLVLVETLYGMKRQAILDQYAQESVSAMRKAFDAQVAEMQSQISDLAQGIHDDVQSYAGNALDGLRGALDAQQKLIDSGVDEQKKAIDSAHEARMKALAQERETAQANVQRLQSLAGTLRNAFDGMGLQGEAAALASRQSAQAQLAGWAKGGKLPAQAELERALSAVQGDSQQYFSSYQDYARDAMRTAISVGTLADRADAQLSDAERQLAALDGMEQAAQRQHEESLAQAEKAATQQADDLQAIYDEAQRQVNAALGIEDATLSVADAQAQVFTAVQLATEASLQGIEFQAETNNLLAAQIAQDLQQHQELVAALANLSAPVMNYSVTGGALDGQVSALPAFASGGDFGGGLRIVGENGPELEVTGPSRIFNANQTRDILSGGDNRELIQELRALRQALESGQFQIAKNTGRTAKLLERWEGDGLPETRTA